MKAHEIALAAEKLADLLAACDLPTITRCKLLSLANTIRKDAERLTDELDPCNPNGQMPALYPDLMFDHMKASGALPANVLPFRR